jgi:hypothetical protein
LIFHYNKENSEKWKKVLTAVNAIGRKEKSATKLALRKQDEIGQALTSSERNEKEVSPSGSIKV